MFMMISKGLIKKGGSAPKMFNSYPKQDVLIYFLKTEGESKKCNRQKKLHITKKRQLMKK